MKKNYIKLLFISFFLFLIIPLNAYADDGYVIENYKVDIKVNENNVLNVKEQLDVDFKEYSHGIFRTIPYINNITRDDINTKNKAKIKNVKINEQSSISKEDGKITYKIGDPYKTIIGEKTYIISFDYDFGDDNIDEYDELYYNIIPTDVSANIENVEFTIEMPKDFDKTKVNFPMGRYGSTYYEDVEYTIENNIIKGSIKKDYQTGYALNMYEGLTVRIELDEGYFVNERKVFDPTFIIIISLILISIFIILVST